MNQELMVIFIAVVIFFMINFFLEINRVYSMLHDIAFIMNAQHEFNDKISGQIVKVEEKVMEIMDGDD